MTRAEAQKLPHGIYRLHWKTGGTSLAAVGSDAKGMRWMAPINWVTVRIPDTVAWRAVSQAERIEIEPLKKPDDQY